MKRYLATSVIVVICLLLLIYIRFFEQKKEDQNTLFTLDQSQIVQLTITEGEDKLILNHSPQWQIEGKPDFAIDPVKVERILEAFAAPQVTVLQAEKIDPSLFGLNPPEKTLTIQTPSGVEKKLFLGRKTPIGGNVYLMTPNSEKIYLIPDYQAAYLSAKPETFKPESDPPSQ